MGGQDCAQAISGGQWQCPGSWAAALELSMEHPGNEVIYPPFTDACLELARLSWLLVELVEDGCHI